MFPGAMRVAVEEKIESPTLLNLHHQALIVTVEKCDLHALDLELAEWSMQRLADAVNRLLQGDPLDIAVAVHEMCGQAVKQPDGIGVLDVAAMDDVRHLPFAQDSEDFLDGLIATVRVADDRNLHGVSRVAGSSLRFVLQRET
jgi:hypothetical protein